MQVIVFFGYYIGVWICEVCVDIVYNIYFEEWWQCYLVMFYCLCDLMIVWVYVNKGVVYWKDFVDLDIVGIFLDVV